MTGRRNNTFSISGRAAAMAVVLAIVMLLAGVHSGRAEMFLCRDQSGAMNFTNVRNGPDCQPYDLQQDNGSWANVSRSGFGRSGRSGGADPARYDQEIRMVGTRYNVDPSLIKAIIHAESNFDDQAVSRKGAQGLMQLMPDTARDLRVANPFDPRQNIEGGTRYFRSLLDTFNGNLTLSLAAYNAGPGLVSRTGGVPEIPETLQYIKKVLKQYKWYQATWSLASSG